MSSENQETNEAPIVLTANARCERLQKQRERATQTITDLLDLIGEVHDRIKQGDMETNAQTAKVLGELKYWLRAARETELELEAIIRKDEGIVDTYGLDLEAARFAVGCRLDRLRACCAEGEIPG